MSVVNKIIKYALLLSLVVQLSACLSISRHPRDVKPTAKPLFNKPYEVIGVGKGQSSHFNLAWLFAATPRMSVDEAIANAINEKGGDNLIDVIIWTKREIWIVGTVETVYVEGKVIRYINAEF